MKKLTNEQVINRITMDLYSDDITKAPGYYKVEDHGRDLIGISPWHIYRQYIPVWTEAAIEGGYEPMNAPGTYEGEELSFEDCVRLDVSCFLQSNDDGGLAKNIMEAAIAGGITEKLAEFFGCSEATADLEANGYL